MEMPKNSNKMNHPQFTRTEEHEMEVLLSAQQIRTLSREEEANLDDMQRKYNAFIAEGLEKLRRIAPSVTASPPPLDTKLGRIALLRGMQRNKPSFWLSVSLCLACVLMWRRLPPIALLQTGISPSSTSPENTGKNEGLFSNVTTSTALVSHAHFQVYLVLCLCTLSVACRSDREQLQRMMLVLVLASSAVLLLLATLVYLGPNWRGGYAAGLNDTHAAAEASAPHSLKNEARSLLQHLAIVDTCIAGQCGLSLLWLKRRR